MKTAYLTAIDIGSGSIKGISLSKNFSSQKYEIVAKSQSRCLGVRHGEIVDPENVSRVILEVKEDLALQGKVKIKEAIVNVGGSRLFSFPSQGTVSVSRADQKISKEDVLRVLRQAELVSLPSNKNVIKVFPQEFIIDKEKGIKSPIDLHGMKLEVRALLACIFSRSFDNIFQAFDLAGISKIQPIISPLACARAVLSEEQKELGVVMIEMGFGSTSIAVFEKGGLMDFFILPLGSSNITTDIALGLRTEIKTAEKIKKDFATLRSSSGKGVKSTIKLADSSLEFSRKFLKDIVEARMNQLFCEIQKWFKRVPGSETMPYGVVFSGGGAKIPGLVDFAKQKFKLPVRLGVIKDIGEGMEELDWSCCCGLGLMGFENEEEPNSHIEHKNGSNWLKNILRTFNP